MKYICVECGSDNVDSLHWVGLNSYAITDCLDETKNYCNTCEKECGIIEKVTYSEILDNTLEFLTAKNQLELKIKTFVQDKSIPLVERWYIFIKSDLGEIKNSVCNPDGIDWDNTTLYDDFNCNKDGTTIVEEMLKQCLEFTTMEGDNYFFKPNWKFDETAFKEYCLDNFMKGFINSW